MSYHTLANEISNGKDTLTGHLEMMGIHTVKPFKTFTETGFPDSLIKELEKKWNYRPVANWALVRNQLDVDDRIRERIRKYENGGL